MLMGISARCQAVKYDNNVYAKNNLFYNKIKKQALDGLRAIITQ